MINWFLENISTIIIATIIFVVIIFVIIKIYQDKKQGKTGCSCGCGGCAMKDICKDRKINT